MNTCSVCDYRFTTNQLQRHLQTAKHTRNLVIAQLHSEVRTLREQRKPTDLQSQYPFVHALLSTCIEPAFQYTAALLLTAGDIINSKAPQVIANCISISKVNHFKEEVSNRIATLYRGNSAPIACVKACDDVVAQYTLKQHIERDAIIAKLTLALQNPLTACNRQGLPVQQMLKRTPQILMGLYQARPANGQLITQNSHQQIRAFNRQGEPVSSEYSSQIINCDRFWKQDIFYRGYLVQTTSHVGNPYEAIDIESMPGYSVIDEKHSLQILYKPAESSEDSSSVQDGLDEPVEEGLVPPQGSLTDEVLQQSEQSEPEDRESEDQKDMYEGQPDAASNRGNSSSSNSPRFPNTE